MCKISRIRKSLRENCDFRQNYLFVNFYFLAELQTIVQSYWQRLYDLEGDKFDLERQSALKDFEVTSRLKLREFPVSNHHRNVISSNFKLKMLIVFDVIHSLYKCQIPKIIVSSYDYC